MLLTGLAADADAVLHTDHTVPAFLIQMTEYVLVIDLAAGRFFTARIVAGLEVGDFVPTMIDVGDEVPFGDLLMINVEQNFAAG